MSPDTHLSQCLGGKVHSPVDLTPSVPPLSSIGRRAWSGVKDSTCKLKSPTNSLWSRPTFMFPYTVHVLLGNSGRKHIAKGGRQWTYEMRET